MKKSCQECGTPVRLTSLPVAHCTLLTGKCPKCSAACVSLSGNPAEILFGSMFLSMHFCEMAHTMGRTLGMSDPFEHDPQSILDLVAASRAAGGCSIDLSQLQ